MNDDHQSQSGDAWVCYAKPIDRGGAVCGHSNDGAAGWSEQRFCNACGSPRRQVALAEFDSAASDAHNAEENPLTSRKTVAELVATFAAAEASVRAAFGRIVEAQLQLDATFNLKCIGYGVRISAMSHDRRYGSEDFEDLDGCVRRMRRAAWITIVDRLEVRRAMSIERERALTKELDEQDDPPEITEANVVAFVGRFVSDLPTMWKDAVLEVFEWLRPREYETVRGAYKTNQKHATFEIGERVVLTSLISRSFGGGFIVRYDLAETRLRALENVFNGLAGNGTVAKTHRGLLVDAINANKDGRGETELFAFRAYKNGALHLRFKRLDLLKRFNQIAGGTALKPSNAA